jgi:hypothetical protein
MEHRRVGALGIVEAGDMPVTQVQFYAAQESGMGVCFKSPGV